METRGSPPWDAYKSIHRGGSSPLVVPVPQVQTPKSQSPKKEVLALGHFFNLPHGP